MPKNIHSPTSHPEDTARSWWAPTAALLLAGLAATLVACGEDKKPVPAAAPEKRNGMCLFPVSDGARLVTPALVKELLDETP